jgi:hypothetical protein
MEIRQPVRATRTFTQHLDAPPARVFPLLCPVREADWADGWEPLWIASQSGLAERGCIFATSGTPDAIWVVTTHDSASGLVEMVKITPGITACVLTIKLSESPVGTDAVVTYEHTSLGPEGDAFVDSFTQEHYDGLMREWESQLNHFLDTGEMLRLPHGR